MASADFLFETPVDEQAHEWLKHPKQRDPRHEWIEKKRWTFVERFPDSREATISSGDDGDDCKPYPERQQARGSAANKGPTPFGNEMENQ